MLSTVQTMPDTARLWIYQADRPFNSEEKKFVAHNAERFVSEWAAHGQDLNATFLIEYDQFLILMVDERQAAASGCSIDSSVGLIRAIEQELNISMLDRSKVAILDGEQVKLMPIAGVKSAVQSGDIQNTTLVFDNSVSSYGDWKSGWKVPADQSWMKRFF